MPVAIVGMHRSGTSLAAQMLAKAGLYLGSAEDLIPAGPDNADGYWEHAGFHRLNEWVLAQLGGGWDSPPAVPERWRDDARIARFADEATRLVATFDGQPVWGWKDPRTSLTLRLWNDAVPALKLIVCVRHPLEVAFSLNRRGMFSYPTSLNLWMTYNERLLEGSGADQRIVVEYDALFIRPVSELRRLASFIGLDVAPEMLTDAAAAAREDLRHVRFDLADLGNARVRRDIVELYEWLQAQAGSGKRKRASARAAPRRVDGEIATRVVDELALEAQSLRAEPPAHTRGLEALEERVSELESELASAHDREAELAREVEYLRAHVVERPELTRSLNELQDSFYMLETALLDRPGAGDDVGAAESRRIGRIKDVIRSETPLGASIAVVSRGDERLVGFYGRRATHFPQTEAGRYAGFHPPSSLAATAHLEVVRARGAEYLLIPADSLWWLEHYAALRRHLAAHYRQIAWDADTCALFALCAPAKGPGRWTAQAAEIAAAARSALGRLPTIVDWNTGLDLENTLSAVWVSRPSSNGRLPYSDKSVDIVALRGRAADALAEAKRVAAFGVIDFPADADAELGLDVQAVDVELAVAGVSLVACVRRGTRENETWLRSLTETLPRGFGGEIVLVDDSFDDRTAASLDRFAETHDRVVVVRNRTRLGVLESVNRGADAAGEPTLVFVDPDALPLPGWLRPLLHVLHEQPDAGAVGGKLLFPDGSLEAAGGLVFDDGSALRFGYAHVDPEGALFDYVRRVDHCSRLLLATPRELFLEAGGFDLRFDPDVFGELDYCLSLRDRGLNVYYQPASACVRLADGSAGRRSRELAVEARVDPRFARKWKALLASRPVRPLTVDLEALHVLADQV